MKPGTEPAKEYAVAGGILLAAGGLLILDQIIKTAWLTLLVFPLVGTGLLVLGIVYRSTGWSISGCIVLGIGLGIFVLLSASIAVFILIRVGLALLAFGGAWILIALHSIFITRKISWWALIPAAVFSGSGIPLCFQSLKIVDFIFCLLLLLGVALTIWGTSAKLFGLIIPGCLSTTIGLGIYSAWSVPVQVNLLAQTGIMLAWFAFGWGLITLFSRRIYERIAWWPLIPGGILAVTGWGLYIGGDPGSAVNFIGNTGTVGVIIFGLYLILMRRGIRQ